ncbi:MAG TPA: membrane-bound O-acyltransferase family protein [Anaerolineaceae bacterium]|jgi:alginate O-acetyltransferase complex protein AlgI|nr:membrane-bound O-acyltransferase family protein [Anaerolineaceae bacterium]
MVFSSQIFLFIFLPLCLLGAYLVRPDFRKYFLILASLAFFTWTSKEALVIFVVFVLINYSFGLLLGKTRSKDTLVKKISIWLVVLTNVAFLLAFKYLPFMTSSLSGVTGVELPKIDLPVLLGVSFFVFSAISYQYDIYYNKIAPQKNLADFVLYMSFFPKLLQGPITRAGDFATQLAATKLDLDKLSRGVYRFTVGLAKKVIIADQLGAMVDLIFANPANANGVSIAWLGAFGYAMQIFFDFSGYTDMAIGLGQMLGFDLPENFNFPYLALNISDFWRRWHITLSSWFRDYVFYPLEFKRRKQKVFRTESNTLIVFFLTGFWHGAGWQFIAWGLWHGLFSSLEAFLRAKKVKAKAPAAVRYLVTMLIVLIGWVLFRSPDLGYGLKYLGVMFGLVKPLETGLTLGWYLNAKVAFILMLAVLACIPWKQWLPKYFEKMSGSRLNDPLRLIVFLILLGFSIMMVMSSTYSSFIYFKF